MSKAISVNRKKRGRPKIGATLVGVRIEPELLSALDKLVDQQGGITRPEAIRLILKDWLTGNQLLPADQEGTRPEDLNASNDG